MRVAIVEKNGNYLEEFIDALYKWRPADVQILISHFSEGREILERFKEGNISFDILFLDTGGTETNVIRLCQQLRILGYNNAVVFTIKAMELSQHHHNNNIYLYNYINKPVTAEQIGQSIALINKEGCYSYTYNGVQVCIPFRDILYFESWGNYVKIHMKKEGMQQKQHKANFTFVQKQLPKNFVRCHRSYIINIEEIESVEQKDVYLKPISTTPIPLGKKHLEGVYLALGEEVF